MSGVMDWGKMYAEETDIGAYLPGTGTAEIPGGAASKGGGAHCWDMDWSWGSEMVPLGFCGFDVEITDLGGGDYRVTMTPARIPPTDYVDIGNTTSEAGHNLQGWGPIEPDTSGGNWGQLASGGYPDYTSVDKKCRCTVNKSSECTNPDQFWGSFDLSTGTGMKATELWLRVLDGQGDDSFEVYVNSNLVKTYAGQGGTETWVIHKISISNLNLSGSIAVTINCTADAWSGCTSWGQLGVDWAGLYAETIPEGDGGDEGGCFIATAAYGTESAKEIDVLRSFRDEVMLESAVGSQLVELYYQTSPPVADFMSENSVLRTVVREFVIDPMVSVATFTQAIWGK
jgi:hypothetical protein